MRVSAVFVAALLTTNLLAQEPTRRDSSTPDKSQVAISCGGGHTVDDYLAEQNKLRKKRNKNPLPGNTCIWGWCRDTSKIPTSHPSEEAPPSPSPATTSSNSNESSSKPKQEVTCDPYSATQDVEVGDFYYQDKNYRAALNRYESANQSKPRDPGIHLRIGKTSEKLGDIERARREYQASIDAAAEGSSGKEAKNALERLASKSAK